MADRRLAAALVAVALLPGCTSFADTVADGRERAAPRADEPPSRAPEPGSCPSGRAAPDPDRPVVDLDLQLADDLRTVTGTERVTFTADAATGEVVFRLVPNGPGSGANALTVDAVRGEDVRDSGYEDAEAEDPGGLHVVRLASGLEPGETTTVELDFTLRLGGEGFDRFGTDDGVSWWATGHPLLALEPGEGFARDPFVGVLGETTVSPAADTTIRVSAPEELTVLMTGDQAQPSAPRNGRRTWTSVEPVARDVAVAAGRFTVEEGTAGDGVRVVTGSLEGRPDAATLLEETVAAVEELEDLLGPFPYGTLTVIGLADYGGGIEYPSAILQASRSDVVLVHEVAHMWFYGMVGNSQFRDPWLDEAFATWAESVVQPTSAAGVRPALALPDDVGLPMDAWQDPGQYFSTVYGKGAAALLDARDRAGPDAFDTAIRCYVDAAAWTVATPSDLAAALADLPAALDVLVEAGALDEEDLPG